MLHFNIFRLFCLLVLVTSFVYGQTDNVGSGRALRFDGVDDYIDLGNVYDDLNFPFTISAWIFIDGSKTTSGGIFDSQNTYDTHYNGFWFAASPTGIFLEYGDGKGTNNPAFRRGKSVSGLNIAGRWNHVSAVVNGISNLRIYLNGQDMGGSLAGNSSSPMDSSFPNDNAHIGNHYINGVYYRFKGMIDELRIFNKALSETEIREQMCRRLKGDEPGLIGYWNFDEESGDVLRDISSNGYDGKLMGNPSRVFSGAPVGDESVLLYTDVWSGAKLSLNTLAVENIKGNPFGIHIYKVNQLPSQTGGLDITKTHQYYYGVFVADQSQGNAFTIREEKICDLFFRPDNSQPSWHALTQLDDIQDRKELIIVNSGDNADFEVSLGESRLICGKTSQTLTPEVTNATGKTYLWNTGESSPSIIVTQSGMYSVSVTDGCSTREDSVLVSFQEPPPTFSLGEDGVLCERETHTLEPSIDGSFEWTWNDGTKGQSLMVKHPGEYWLKIENTCGSATASIRFLRLAPDLTEIPNCITPNGDAQNQHFSLPNSFIDPAITIYNRWGKEVYQSIGYQNTWDAHNLPAGVYFYRLTAACLEDAKGIIHVLR